MIRLWRIRYWLSIHFWWIYRPISNLLWHIRRGRIWLYWSWRRWPEGETRQFGEYSEYTGEMPPSMLEIISDSIKRTTCAGTNLHGGICLEETEKIIHCPPSTTHVSQLGRHGTIGYKVDARKMTREEWKAR